MKKKLKIFIMKPSRKKVQYFVVALTRKSHRTHILDRVGVLFTKNNKRFIMLSVKKLIFWLSKGVLISAYTRYIISFFLIFNRENKFKFDLIGNFLNSSKFYDFKVNGVIAKNYEKTFVKRLKLESFGNLTINSIKNKYKDGILKT